MTLRRNTRSVAYNARVRNHSGRIDAFHPLEEST